MAAKESVDSLKYIRQDFQIFEVPDTKAKGLSERDSFAYVAYKPDFAFLHQGLLSCHHVRTDELSQSRLYYSHGKHFITREMDPDLTISDDLPRLNDLGALKLENCRFEQVVGYFLNNVGGQYDLLVHTYSGGIELFSISVRAPPDLRSRLSRIAAAALADIHRHEIVYCDPVPTDMRWDFADQMILDPHPYVLFREFPEEQEDKTRDLSVFLMTNPWLPDKKEFLNQYCSRLGVDQPKIESLHEQVLARMRFMEKDPELPAGLHPFWLER